MPFKRIERLKFLVICDLAEQYEERDINDLVESIVAVYGHESLGNVPLPDDASRGIGTYAAGVW